MSLADLPRGNVYVGLWGGVRGVKRANGEPVEGLRRLTVVVPTLDMEQDDERLDAAFWADNQGVPTRVAKQIDQLDLVTGELVAVKVDVKARQGSKYLNVNALKVVRLGDLGGAVPPARPVSVKTAG